MAKKLTQLEFDVRREALRERLAAYPAAALASVLADELAAGACGATAALFDEMEAVLLSEVSEAAEDGAPDFPRPASGAPS